MIEYLTSIINKLSKNAADRARQRKFDHSMRRFNKSLEERSCEFSNLADLTTKVMKDYSAVLITFLEKVNTIADIGEKNEPGN